MYCACERLAVNKRVPLYGQKGCGLLGDLYITVIFWFKLCEVLKRVTEIEREDQ